MKDVSTTFCTVVVEYLSGIMVLENIKQTDALLTAS
jgi:hypothetical protein